MYGSDHGGPDLLLLTTHYFLKEVDGDVVKWRKVDANVTGKEVVDLPFALILACELFG